MSDTFESQEFPGKMLKVDPAGKAAEPILNAIADRKQDRADALLARVSPDLRFAVTEIISRYFPEYELPTIACARCGEAFVPARSTARYCTAECRKNRAKKTAD